MAKPEYDWDSYVLGIIRGQWTRPGYISALGSGLTESDFEAILADLVRNGRAVEHRGRYIAAPK